MMSAMRSTEAPRGLAPGTVRRVGRFARPYLASLAVFLVLTVISAVIAVTTPLLAGKVVDVIVSRHNAGIVIVLELVVAGQAIVGAGFGLVERWQSARIDE